MITPSRQTAQVLSVPAPVGGWNARDPLAAMPATDAIVLDNWFPTSSDVRVRDGFTSWATGIGGRVETLMPYASTSTTKLFGVAGGNVYDVSSSGAVGAAVTTFSNSRIEWENFTTAAGNFLMCCSGVDAPQHYNGSVWATPGITGVTGGASTLVQPCAFKSRLFFVQTGSMSVWYLPTNSIAGAATEIPLGGIFESGGYIMAMGTWTLDAGRGVDDHAVFITSRGEVAVYAGSDPSSSTTWSLVGVYRIGSPVGRRCLVKFGGDLLVICQDGILPLSAALQSTRLDTSQAITDKIRSAVSSATSLYSSVFGWQIVPYPRDNALILNVPASTSTQYQYVMNAITGAWCRFTGWNASCFAVYLDNLYFGGLNGVFKAWTGASDNGADIAADAKQAFLDFGDGARRKQFKMVKPYFGTDGQIEPGVMLNIDYNDARVINTGAAIPTTAGVWDVGLWDAAVWGGDLQTLAKWRKVNGFGYRAAIRVAINTNTTSVRWYSTDFAVEAGGIL